MKIRQININTKNRKYPILIGSNLIKNLKSILKNNSINSSKYLLVIDTKVPKKLVELAKKRKLKFSGNKKKLIERLSKSD